MKQRSPPFSRRDRMVNTALTIAASPYSGYSQKPPSGRWGPDYDCSSLIYEIAKRAGYPIDTGGDRVRFTGTMLEDFKEAGFQLLPFANVGINDLKIGDILVNLALHAEICVGDGQTVGAMASETGGYVGEAGDQTGAEIEKHPLLTFDKGWDYVIRPPETVEDGGEPEMDDGYLEEGENEMPMPVPSQFGGMQWTPPQSQTYQPNQAGGLQWTHPQSQTYQPYQQPAGYPQGGFGQTNGYSQIGGGYRQMQQPMNQPSGQPMNQPMNQPMDQAHQNHGYQNPQQGYPQGYPQGASSQLPQVCGLEGARDYPAAAGSTTTIQDAANHDIIYIKTVDQQGYPSIRVYKECSEDMPQHHNHTAMQPNMDNSMVMQQMAIMREELDQLKEMLNHDKSSISSEQSQSANGNARTNVPQSGNQSARRS